MCTGCSSHDEHCIDSVQSPPEVVVKLIGGLWCEGLGCQQNVQLQNLADHLALGCQQHLHLTQQFDNCFHKVRTLQPQQYERRVATSSVKCMLTESLEENIAELVR